MAARQRFFGTLQRASLGRRGGACKAVWGRPTGSSPSRGTPGGRLRVHPGPRWPGGPPGRRAPAAALPPGTRAGPGGGFLGPRAARGGCRGVWWYHHLPPPPHPLAPRAPGPPPGRSSLGLRLCLEFRSNQFGLAGGFKGGGTAIRHSPSKGRCTHLAARARPFPPTLPCVY